MRLSGWAFAPLSVCVFGSSRAKALHRVGRQGMLRGMMCRYWLSLCLVLFASAVIAETNEVKSIPLSTVKLDHSRLNSWGVRLYKDSAITRTEDGGSQMQFRSTQTMGTEVSSNAVKLIDKFVYGIRDFEYDLHCRPDAFLGLTFLKFRITEGGQVASEGIMRVQGATGALRVGGKVSSVPYPGGTVIEAALRRLVVCLPRTPGALYHFDSYSPTLDIHPVEADPDKLYTIHCRGKYKIRTSGDAVMTCTKYEVEIGERITSYYVNEDDVLQRVLSADALLELFEL